MPLGKGLLLSAFKKPLLFKYSYDTTGCLIESHGNCGAEYMELHVDDYVRNSKVAMGEVWQEHAVDARDSGHPTVLCSSVSALLIGCRTNDSSDCRLGKFSGCSLCF